MKHYDRYSLIDTEKTSTMSFVVRRIGGGIFNPDAICFNPNDMNLFVGVGNSINIYSLPDLQLIEQHVTHEAKITALACTSTHLISGDAEGNIYFHLFDEQQIISRSPDEKYKHPQAIEKILVRNDVVYFVYYWKSLFWVQEYNNKNSNLFMNISKQNELVELPSSYTFKGSNWFHFPFRDCFDISRDGNSIIVSNGPRVNIYNFQTQKGVSYESCNARICTFHYEGNIMHGLVFLQSGQMELLDEQGTSKNHWHFQCPNAVVSNNTMIFSGGFEGVLYGFGPNNHRQTFLPRMGRSIEGLAISKASSYIAAIVDKNILALVDPSSNFVRESVSHITGEISFCGHIAVSIRRPNLVQFFDVKTAKCIEQLQVSSYNSSVPIVHAQLTNDLFVTIEICGGEATHQLSIENQVLYNHTKPHADPHISSVAFARLLSLTRFTERREMDKMEVISMETNEANDEIAAELKTVEGNPLVHNTEASSTADYSEIKIWKRGEQRFEVDTSFRIVGKVAGPLSVHPVLPIFGVVVEKELQIWKNNGGRWQLWRTKLLPEIPRSLVWSPDGTVLVFHYPNRVVLFDAEDFSVLHTETFPNNILTVLFKNEYELVIHTRPAINVFDLRTLSVSTIMYKMATAVAALGDLIAFLVDDGQTVVLVGEKTNIFWHLPTKSSAHKISIGKEGQKMRITVIDDDDFIWSVDQFGQEETHVIRPTSLPSVQPKAIDLNKKKIGEMKIDFTSAILDVINVPSHQIPKIDEISTVVFKAINAKKNVNAIEPVAVELVEDGMEINDENPEIVELDAQELTALKATFF